jgi:hypothetical protein
MNGYNGYKNYETWLVAVHIDNTQETQEAAKGLDHEELKTYVYNMVDTTSLFTADLANSTLEEVDFRELVETINEG